MNEKEEFKLLARLAAHELLLRDMLLVVRGQKAMGKRLAIYRDQLKESVCQLTFSELNKTQSRRMKALVRKHALATIDAAIDVLRQERQRGKLKLR